MARRGTLEDFTDAPARPKRPAPSTPGKKKADAGPEVLTVSELNRRVRRQLEAAPALQGLHVSGEISNLFISGAGHAYFTLKEDHAEVRCIMWRDAAARLAFEPKNGLAVLAYCDVTLYEQRGQYQLRVVKLEPAGEGLLWLKLGELKKKLEAEGLFDEARKKPLPRIPMRVGVVTSQDGAALHDILNVLSRRAPYLELLMVDARVQGKEAAGSLIAGLKRLEREQVDVVIMGRGGGSLEDLWAFNEELVVRAVADYPHPIVCAVGHETDWSLSDLAADWRAPTPSAAAERIAPSIWELHQGIDNQESRLGRYLSGRLEVARGRLQALADRPVFTRPDGLVTPQRRLLEDLSRRMQRATTNRLDGACRRLDLLAARPVLVQGQKMIDVRRARVKVLADRLPRTTDATLKRAQAETRRMAGMLDALSPLKVLSRGYGVATKDGQVVKKTDDVAPGDPLEVRITDGTIETKVTGKRRNPK